MTTYLVLGVFFLYAVLTLIGSRVFFAAIEITDTLPSRTKDGPLFSRIEMGAILLVGWFVGILALKGHGSNFVKGYVTSQAVNDLRANLLSKEEALTFVRKHDIPVEELYQLL